MCTCVSELPVLLQLHNSAFFFTDTCKLLSNIKTRCALGECRPPQRPILKSAMICKFSESAQNPNTDPLTSLQPIPLPTPPTIYNLPIPAMTPFPDHAPPRFTYPLPLPPLEPGLSTTFLYSTFSPNPGPFFTPPPPTTQIHLLTLPPSNPDSLRSSHP